jgi:hypothetical protein
MTYEEWVAALAAKRNTSVELLENTYGDMLRDMYELGDSVEVGNDVCNWDDIEYSGKDRVYG